MRKEYAHLNESNLALDFQINYRAIHHEKHDDRWELYALMQHHGLPTRLLDWSKSPLIALYFALEKNSSKNASRVVWILNPAALNKLTRNVYSVIVPTDIAHVGANRLDHRPYLPWSIRPDVLDDKLPSHPLAIEPPLTNKRLTNQQGCFTVHGELAKPIETYFKGSGTSGIVKILIKGETVRKRMLRALDDLGFTEDAIYRDLGSLCRRLVKEESS